MSYSPWDRVSDNITFDRFPHLGFEIGTDPGQKARFAFWRQGGPADDWQVTKRVESRQAVLSTRVVRQRLPDGPMVLDTGLWFRSGADYRTFLALSSTAGTLRMNRNATMHQADRTVTLLGRTYAEFDNVHVIEINAQSFDLDGGVRCHVIFERDAPAYTITTLKPFADPPFPLLPFHGPAELMDNPPTVTLGASAGSSVIAGSALVDKDSPLFTFYGGHAIVGTGFPNDNYISPAFAASASEVYVAAPWGVEFEYDGSEFELRLKGTGAQARYRLTVDGEGYVSRTGNAGPTADGATWLVHYDFETAAARRIRFDFAGDFAFGGIYRESTAALTATTKQFGPKVVIIGDSFTEGTGATTPITGFYERLRDYMGWVDVTPSGWGSTGYIADNGGARETFGTRLQKDAIDQAPDVVILAGGINDHLELQATISTAVDAVMDELAADLPDAEVIALGPFWPSGSPPSTIVQTRDTIRTQALAHGFTFIDNIGGVVPYSGSEAAYVNTGWITGTGDVSAPVGDGNADIYTSPDGTHPSQAGHDYYGNRIALALADVLPDLLVVSREDVPPPPVAADYEELILDHGTDLEAYWRLNEPSGATADNLEGTAANDATVANATYSVAGALTGDADTCFTFNGTSTKVEASGISGLHDTTYSMALWFYNTRAHSSGLLNGYLICRGNGSAADLIGLQGTLEGANTGKIFVTNDTTWHHSTTVTDLNEWYFVGFSRNGSNVKLYVGDNAGNFAKEVDQTLTAAFATDRICIGVRSDNQWWYQGRIDEPAIFNVELSEAEFEEMYQYGIGVLP